MLQTLSRIRYVEEIVPTATSARRVHKRRGENGEATKESRREETPSEERESSWLAPTRAHD
jgi:hypothetical protein